MEYAAFGTRNTLDSVHGWSSHGVCITSRCQAGVAWSVSVATPRATLPCNAHTSCRSTSSPGAATTASRRRRGDTASSPASSPPIHKPQNVMGQNSRCRLGQNLDWKSKCLLLSMIQIKPRPPAQVSRERPCHRACRERPGPEPGLAVQLRSTRTLKH